MGVRVYTFPVKENVCMFVRETHPQSCAYFDSGQLRCGMEARWGWLRNPSNILETLKKQILIYFPSSSIEFEEAKDNVGPCSACLSVVFPVRYLIFTDGCKIVSPTHLPRSTPQKHFSASGTHLC
jgi:hypothetical protein